MLSEGRRKEGKGERGGVGRDGLNLWLFGWFNSFRSQNIKTLLPEGRRKKGKGGGWGGEGGVGWDAV